MKQLAALLVLAPALAAQARPWSHPDGTTHWYEAVAAPAPVTWAEAHAAAAAAGGYLVTITSREENTFVFSLVDRADLWSQDSTSGLWRGPWTGGFQAPQSREPDAGWSWTELEPFSFQIWAAGQPDNAGGADRIHFGGSKTGRTVDWADAPASAKLLGYVIEYSGAMTPVTVGLMQREAPSAFGGYTLFTPLGIPDTFLIDGQGRVVHRWRCQYDPGLAVYLLPNGHLLRCGNVGNMGFSGGRGGIVQELDWDSKPIWEFRYSSSTQLLHHDVERLPGGNTLMIAWETKTQVECITAGRNPNLVRSTGLWPDKILEVDAAGKIVWQWCAWDHLVQDYDSTKANYGVVAQHPELIDLNFPSGTRPDWLHSNAVAYNPKLDQIMLSVRHFNEIWVIDHSTTMAEAAGHKGGRSGKGGDLLYRWGNPLAYRAGSATDQRLFGQHDAHWIPDSRPGGGHFLVFNNGGGRPGGNASTVDEIVPPQTDSKGNYPRSGKAWGPSGPVWTYPATPTGSFFSPLISGAERLANGNTMICLGVSGRLLEVTAAKSVVWDYLAPGWSLFQPGFQGDVARANQVFKSRRYAKDYPGLRGRDLTPGDPIESYTCALLADGSMLPRRVRVGGSVSLGVRSMGNGGRFYLVGTSLTRGMIPVDHRVLRVGFDEVLLTSMLGQLPTVFQGYFGTLDASGNAQATLAVPPVPALAGLSFETAFLVLEPSVRSGITAISNPVTVRVDP